MTSSRVSQFDRNQQFGQVALAIGQRASDAPVSAVQFLHVLSGRNQQRNGFGLGGR